jgi:hypothetical protein
MRARSRKTGNHPALRQSEPQPLCAQLNRQPPKHLQSAPTERALFQLVNPLLENRRGRRIAGNFQCP